MNPLIPIQLTHFLVLSALIAAAGVATLLTKRNAIGILIGVELLLNAAAVNLVAISRFHPWDPSGQPALDGKMFAVFVIVLAAAEAAVALAIFLNYYHQFNTVDVEQAGELKG